MRIPPATGGGGYGAAETPSSLTYYSAQTITSPDNPAGGANPIQTPSFQQGGGYIFKKCIAAMHPLHISQNLGNDLKLL